ncbi:pseudouridine synthase, partial [Burkholderia vietnamiensis]|nr:pseudouridine synthase [Burkholderia vietnamiensis]
MRTKLTVKNPRPASPTRAPVRSGSLVARKAVRPAAPAPGDKPPRAQKPAAAGAGKRAVPIPPLPTAPAPSRTRVETVMDTLRARIASRALMPGARV